MWGARPTRSFTSQGTRQGTWAHCAGGPGLRPQRQGSSVARIPGRPRELLAPELAIKPPVPNNPVIPSNEAGTTTAPSPGEQ